MTKRRANVETKIPIEGKKSSERVKWLTQEKRYSLGLKYRNCLEQVERDRGRKGVKQLATLAVLIPRIESLSTPRLLV